MEGWRVWTPHDTGFYSLFILFEKFVRYLWIWNITEFITFLYKENFDRIDAILDKKLVNINIRVKKNVDVGTRKIVCRL